MTHKEQLITSIDVADTYALDTFKDEEDAQYYFDVTD